MRRALLCLTAVSVTAPAENPARDDAGGFFDKRVAPILSKRCLGCHNNDLNDGGISFLDRDSLIKGGGRGPAVVPGKPEDSVLIHAVRQDGDLKMPPGGKLSARETAALIEWVRRGASWGKKLRPKQ